MWPTVMATRFHHKEWLFDIYLEIPTVLSSRNPTSVSIPPHWTRRAASARPTLLAITSPGDPGCSRVRGDFRVRPPIKKPRNCRGFFIWWRAPEGFEPPTPACVSVARYSIQLSYGPL